MEIVIVSQEEVHRLLPMARCIDVMETALRTLARGDAVQPLRSAMWLPDDSGLLGLMPAYLGGDVAAMGVKAISVMMADHGDGDSHQGTVTLFDREDGRPLAIVDARAITAIRTAATSAVATRLLAREEANDLAILGSGVQARSHLEAMLAVRLLGRIRVWSRTPAHAQAYGEWAAAEHGVTVEVTPSAEDAVTGASIICTVTAAPKPILKGAWLSPGAHINAVGSSVRFTRELDTGAVAGSRLFVDRRESTLNEAGDFLFPQEEGVIDENHIQAEIGDVLLGHTPGRETDEEITLFKSLGLGVEDVAAAHFVYRQAIRQGLGATVEL
ncbi:MAG: ornithine cyclodeaminase family protein [Candidatus Promineifilaceae bacterium]|nr:ornithine cyclodeaminase family protein [Candidatus Promineifilaceae bacterium]